MDRGELASFLYTAERSSPMHAALAVLLGLHGLRVSEACATNLEELGFERGHRTLRVIGKGNQPATVPLVPRTAKALYSVPGSLIGSRVDVRADRTLVRIYQRGQLVKVHPRQPPGRRSTDPTDLPTQTTVYAVRDLDRLQRMAAAYGHAIGTYATALLDIPLP